jgi:N-acetylmuramoyl-L-alanine amidase
VIRTAAHSSFNRLLFLLFLGVSWSIFQAVPAVAARPSTLLSKAEREFTNLKKNRSLQLKRHNYEKVESRYSRVFSGHPGTKEAAKALLRCGELYTLLYRWNSRKADLNSSRDYYRRLLRDYPRSSLADNAQFGIANLYLLYYDDPARAYQEFQRVLEIGPKGDMASDARAWTRKLRRYRTAPSAPVPTAAPSPTKSSSTASALLQRADREFAALKKDSQRQRFRHHYMNVLDRYRRVFEKHSGTLQAETALLRAGKLYTLLYRWTSLKPDLNSAKHYYQRLVKDYPSGTLADDAQIAIAYLYLDKYKDPARAYLAFQKVAWVSPGGDRNGEAARQLRALSRYKPSSQASPASPPGPSSPVPAVLARVTGIRHWSNPSYTRVVIDLDGPSRFYSNLLKESSAMKKPPRLYIDLFNSHVASRLRSAIPVNDGILLSIRPGQFTPDTVRVVLDIDQLQSYNIFPMENPYRIVIDATGGSGKLPARTVSRTASPPSGTPDRYSLAQQLGLGIRKVVIDAGHGAHDPGAVGTGKLREKDVTLDLALRLRDILRREGLEVVLTRDRDVYLGLEERTAIANRSHGDIFLSLHANSSKRPNLRGVETYFLNLASSQRAMETAALENSMAVAKMSDLEDIVQEIFNSKMDESNRLAGIVQKQMISHLRRHYRDIKDLGVKQAPFYVLIGAQMPSILAEVSFINHPVEGKRLASPSYRQHLAEALAEGVKGYIRTVKLASAGR